ncbi:MAG TPA: ATP-binding protein [bacterium]|nr:ATP-binding protein [bacterium]
MKEIKVLNTRFLRPRNLLIIFLVVATLMVTSALIELRNSKQELFTLMEEQAQSLLETILITSDNALIANEQLEELLRERLLDNAHFIRSLYASSALDNRQLSDIVMHNQINRAAIINASGQQLYGYRDGDVGTVSPSLVEMLSPVFQGWQDTLVVGMQMDQDTGQQQYMVVLATPDNNAIVLGVNADNILEFRRRVGFGGLLRKFIDNQEIVYVALQNYSGIIAASGNVQELERIDNSEFLESALMDSTYTSRINEFESVEVFETVHPFYYQGNLVGVFRLGLSLEPLHAINVRIYRRIVIITIVLLGIGFLAFSAILVRENMQILERQYQVVETYSNNIIQEVGDGIIVYDQSTGVKIYNRAAEQIFGRSEEAVLGEPVKDILGEQVCQEILQSRAPVYEFSCTIQGQTRHLLASRTTFTDENGIDNVILVLRDLTEQRQLEEQIQRKERLSAMGELASGVAHEIRNPLNTIGMIIQQLDSDFHPDGDSEEYHKLNQLVHQEVRRINETVQNFLRFARPEAMDPEEFELKEFLESIVRQFKPMADQHDITLSLHVAEEVKVIWDVNQMQQVLLNLVQNAIDAIESGAAITIRAARVTGGTIELHVRDTGPGIPEDVREKIFNLYFTTKPKGTGIGLGIVQRIIYEHGGTISVNTTEGAGTDFVLRLPEQVGESKNGREV